jgi:hypothetical protein
MGAQALKAVQSEGLVLINCKNIPAIPEILDDDPGLRRICDHDALRGIICLDPKNIRFKLVSRKELSAEWEKNIGATANVLNFFLKNPKLIPDGMTGEVFFTGTSFFDKNGTEMYCFLTRNGNKNWECDACPIESRRNNDYIFVLE